MSPALKARSWASRLTSECDTIMAVLAPAQLPSYLYIVSGQGSSDQPSTAARPDRGGDRSEAASHTRSSKGRHTRARSLKRANKRRRARGEGGGRLWRGAGGGRLWRLGTEPSPPLGSGGELWGEGVELCEGGGDGGGLAQGETEIREGCEGGRDVEA